VRYLKYSIGVESVPRRPFAPGAFDAHGGVDEDAVEVEEDGCAYRMSPASQVSVRVFFVLLPNLATAP